MQLNAKVVSLFVLSILALSLSVVIGCGQTAVPDTTTTTRTTTTTTTTTTTSTTTPATTSTTTPATTSTTTNPTTSTTSTTTTTVISSSRLYNGAGSVGDYVTFEVDANDFSWGYTNYTSTETLGGPYTISPDGTYLATVEGTNRHFDIIELPDVALFAPVSRESGPLPIVATERGAFFQTQLMGQYFFVDFGMMKGWGTYEVRADDTLAYTYYDLTTPEVVLTQEAGQPYTYHNDGTITMGNFPEVKMMISPSGVLVIDYGPGNGFIFGVKKDIGTTIEAGTYTCMEQSTGRKVLCTIEAGGTNYYTLVIPGGRGTLTEFLPGAMTFVDDDPARRKPFILILLTGGVFAGIQENSPGNVDGFVGVKLH